MHGFYACSLHLPSELTREHTNIHGRIKTSSLHLSL